MTLECLNNDRLICVTWRLRLNSKISAGVVAGAADLVRSPLRSRSVVPRSRSASLRPALFFWDPLIAPLCSTRVLSRSAPFSAPLTCSGCAGFGFQMWLDPDLAGFRNSNPAGSGAGCGDNWFSDHRTIHLMKLMASTMLSAAIIGSTVQCFLCYVTVFDASFLTKFFYEICGTAMKVVFFRLGNIS